MSLPLTPRAQLSRQRWIGMVLALLAFAFGVVVGWVMCRTEQLAAAAELVIERVEWYRVQQCAELVGALRPGLC